MMINPYSKIDHLPIIENPLLVKHESRKIFLLYMMKPFNTQTYKKNKTTLL